MTKPFVERLKELRGSLSQSEFANKIGTKQTTYSSWERGIKEPGISSIISISNTFGVSTDWLLGLSDVRTTTQSIEPPMIGLNKRQSLQRDDVAFELAAIRRQLEQQQREIAALKELNQTQTACCA